MNQGIIANSITKSVKKVIPKVSEIAPRISKISQNNNVSSEDMTSLMELDATKCGVWSSNIAKTQDNEKYEKIYKNLDDKSKEKFDNLSQKDKDVILTIFGNSIHDAHFTRPSDDSSQNLIFNKIMSKHQNFIKKQSSTILNNLIEISQNETYSDLKDYLSQNAQSLNSELDVFKNYQVCDVNNYLNTRHTSPEKFFSDSYEMTNFKRIMFEIKRTKFENEEIKNQVKKTLYELVKRRSSEQDIASIIKFLTNKNEKFGKMDIKEKSSMLKQIEVFDYGYYNSSGYNVKDKLDVFNTLVDLIPENESFLNYKDKIIDCVNNSAKNSYDARKFLEDLLKPNIETIKEKDYKTFFNRIKQLPYDNERFPDYNLYCALIIDKDNKYANTSVLIINLILNNSKNKQEFENCYDKCLSMLQKADDKTLSNIKPYMLSSLYEFYAFFNEIQVNNEDMPLESLPFQQLKELQLLLRKNNRFLRDINISFIHDNIDKIFIKNDNEINYDSTLSEVNKLLAVKHLDFPQTQKDNINNILDVKDDLAKINFEEIKIDKTNNLEVLKSNVKNILENDNSIQDSDKKIILARLTNDIGSLMFNELPQNLNQLEVIQKIKKEVSQYFSFNKVQNEENAYTIGDVKISRMDDKTKSTLEFIFKAIPELVVLLGVNQKEHNFDIGKHILAVGKEVVKNDKFQTLSQNNQKLVLIAALMHDIAKIDGGHDVLHSQIGSQYAYNMLNGVLSDDNKATVANLIFNHHFGEAIAEAENNNEKMYTLAYECKDENPEFLNMLEILGKADLLGDDESYRARTQEFLEQIPERIETLTQNVQTINDILSQLKDNLKLTPFPQKTLALTQDRQTAMQECKELGIVGEFKSKDITMDKIDLAKMKNLSPEKQEKYLSLLGFHNTQYNQLEFLIHAIDNGIHVSSIDDLTSQFKSNATLSTSIITMANTATYGGRKYGFIMEPDKTKVLYTAIYNIVSGCDKGRNVSGKYISQSNNMNYTKLLEYLEYSKLRAQNGHSELITIDNEVAAIFVKEGYEKDIPKELVEFAYKRNLPLIVVPNTKTRI